MGFYPFKEYQCTDSFKKGIVDSKSVELMLHSRFEFNADVKSESVSHTKKIFQLFVMSIQNSRLSFDDLTNFFNFDIPTSNISSIMEGISPNNNKSMSLVSLYEEKVSRLNELGSTLIDSDIDEEIVTLKVTTLTTL